MVTVGFSYVYTVLLAYYMLVLRGRGGSNHIATKMLPRLAPGQ